MTSILREYFGVLLLHEFHDWKFNRPENKSEIKIVGTDLDDRAISLLKWFDITIRCRRKV